MAKVLGGIGSNLSGKAEGTVFVQFNGGVYTRRAPQYKKDSWTPRQAAARQRFGAINSFCRQFSYSVIPQIWKPAAVKMGGFAFFLKSNMPAFGLDGSLEDVKKLRLSTGKLTWPEEFEVHRAAELSNTVEVSWAKDMRLGGIHLKDELMGISAGDGQYSYVIATGIQRGALNGTFQLPVLPAEATHIYLFFGSMDRQNYSESICFEL